MKGSEAWVNDRILYGILIAPPPNHSSVTSCEGEEGRAHALYSALICTFKPWSHKQGTPCECPCGGGRAHQPWLQVPSAPVLWGRCQWRALPVARSGCSSLALHPVSEVPADNLSNGFHHLSARTAMRGWRAPSPSFLQCRVLTAQPEGIQLFLNFSFSISCHVNNRQCFE